MSWLILDRTRGCKLMSNREWFPFRWRDVTPAYKGLTLELPIKWTVAYRTERRGGGGGENESCVLFCNVLHDLTTWSYHSVSQYHAHSIICILCALCIVPISILYKRGICRLTLQSSRSMLSRLLLRWTRPLILRSDGFPWLAAAPGGTAPDEVAASELGVTLEHKRTMTS